MEPLVDQPAALVVIVLIELVVMWVMLRGRAAQRPQPLFAPDRRSPLPGTWLRGGNTSRPLAFHDRLR